MTSTFNAVCEVVCLRAQAGVIVATLFMMAHWRILLTVLAGLWIPEMGFALAPPRRALNGVLLVILVLEITVPVAFVIFALTIRQGGAKPLDGLGELMLLVAVDVSLSVLATIVVVPVTRTYAKEFKHREGIPLARYVGTELWRELGWWVR